MEDIGIGIDVGASKIVVAACRGGKSEVVVNGEGRRSTQFCLAFNNKERLFGDAADGQYPINPENTIYGRDAKQWIGLRKPDIEKKISPLTDALKIAGENKNVKFDVDYKERPQTQLFPEHIFTMFLRKIKSGMESANQIKVSKAVITVPSMFNSYQRFAVKNAVIAAGIDVQAILNDTTATAITYAIDREESEEENVLIFDMGASTTDVAVVYVSDTLVEVRACGGSLDLGGDTFDLRLVQHFIDEFEREKGICISDDKKMIARLRVSCEKLKKMLSTKSEAKFFIPSFYKGKAYQLKMTRTTFEEMCADLFVEIAKFVSDVVVASNVDIDEVVVVGNGGRIPKVEEVILEHCNGEELSKVLNYDEAVAFGAAHFAAQTLAEEGTIRHLEVNQSIGTPLKMQIGDMLFLTIVKKGKLLPFDLETTFEDKYDLSVTFVQGEYFLTFVKLQKGTLDIQWNVDANGLMKLTSQDIDETQKELLLLDHQTPNDMKIKEIQEFEEVFEEYELEYKKAMEIKNEVEKLCFGYRGQVKTDETKRFLPESDCNKITDICNDTLVWLENPTQPQINELIEKLQTVQSECDSVIEKAKYRSEVQHANKHLEENNYKDASSLYKHILDTYGKYIDEETHFYLTMQRITALTEMEDYQECVELSEDLLQNHNDLYYVQIVRRTRGRCHFELKNYQECIDDVEFVLKHDECPELHNLLNQAILELNLHQRCDEIFAEADNLTKSKQFHESNAVLRELLDKPELENLSNNEIDFTAKLYMMAARNHFKLGEFKKVIEDCNHAESDPENHVEVWDIRAESYIEEEMLREAEKDIGSLGTVESFKKGRLNDLMRKFEGKRYDVIKREHDILKKNKQYQLARNTLKQVNVDKLEKGHKLDYLCNQAFLLWQLHRSDEAVKMCCEALSIDKRYTRAFELRARCFLDLKEYQKAIADCDAALTLGTVESSFMHRVKKNCEEAMEKKASLNTR